jgi:hypothetical protein
MSRCPSAVLIFIMTVIACGQHSKASGKLGHVSPIDGEPKVVKKMTVSDLRPALLRTVNAYPKVFSPLTKDLLENAPIKELEELNGIIEISSFRCDLEKKTFVFSPGGYWGPGYANGIIYGKFILDEKSEWVGKLTGMIRK